MKGSDSVSEKVVSRIANSAALTVPGVESVTGSWAELGTRTYPRCDLNLDPHARAVEVNSYIAVSWPSPVTDIATKVQANIATWLEAMTNFTVRRVNVTVEHTIDNGVRITEADVNEAAAAPKLDPISVKAGTDIKRPVTRSAADHVVSPRLKSYRTPVVPELPIERPLAPISVAPAWEAFVPPLPPERPVSRPHLKSQKSPELPVVPKPAPLAKVSVPESHPVKVTVPRERPLARVQVPKLPPLTEQRIPPERPLRKIRTRNMPVVHAGAPAAEPLAPVTRVAAAPEVPITVPEHDLKPIVVREPEPLKPIYVEPLNRLSPARYERIDEGEPRVR